MKFLILVINDYPTWVWTNKSYLWLEEYTRACARYFKEKLKIEEEIEFIVSISETSYPKDRIQGGYVSVDDTLIPLGESALQSGYNAIMVLTRHKGWWNKNNPQGTSFVSWMQMGWGFTWFDPSVIEEKYFYRALIPFSHELLHHVLFAIGDGRNIDIPPYRDATTITEELFEGKYPIQKIP